MPVWVSDGVAGPSILWTGGFSERLPLDGQDGHAKLEVKLSGLPQPDLNVGEPGRETVASHGRIGNR